MDNYNIRQDRPKLSSDEIAHQKDFDGLLNDFHIMKKPFYKNPWFFGVTGMATVGLLIGTTYSFVDSPAELPQLAEVTESVPPEHPTKTIYLASMETSNEEQKNQISETPKVITLKKKQIHDNTSTLKQNNKLKSKTEEALDSESILKEPLKELEKSSNNAALQNHPRINGKIGGQLSLNKLKKGVSVTTDSEIPIDGFEMHLATEFGAKIYSSSSKELTPEMLEALQSANVNTEVYFEQIKGVINESKSIGLSPLKYTLVY
ncbi:MAG: hypothetical protein AB8B74_06135 [Crocinitomicaceae bacterium]